MKMNIKNTLAIAAISITTGVIGVGCTKADYSDDYVKGDAPPVPGGYVNSREVATSDLVAYWSFNGGLADSIGNVAGTNKGTSFGSGQKAQALQIADTNYYLFNTAPAAVTGLTAYTISFWYNAPQNTSFGYGIFSLNNPADFWGSLDIYLDNGSSASVGQFKVHMTNANASAANQGKFLGIAINNAWNRWVHMVVTYDASTTTTGSNFNIYQNGNNVYSTLIKDGTNNYGPLRFPNPTKMVIGTWQFQPTPSLTNSATKQPWAGSFQGKLDEFRIYKRPLTGTEVTALYQLERQGR